jgi:hypothetical protein
MKLVPGRNHTEPFLTASAICWTNVAVFVLERTRPFKPGH